MNEIALRLAARLFDQPLIQNQYRSAFIEAMLEPHLARVGWRHVGDNWAGWDFQHHSGTRLEVKQSAAWQTWSSPRQNVPAGQEKAGVGLFDIAERTGSFDETGAFWTAGIGRPAHIYVFAWNAGVGAAADHRDPAQWEFFIVRSADLPQQKTLRLSRLRGMVAESFAGPERCAEALTPAARSEEFAFDSRYQGKRAAPAATVRSGRSAKSLLTFSVTQRYTLRSSGAEKAQTRSYKAATEAAAIALHLAYVTAANGRFIDKYLGASAVLEAE